MIHAKCTRLVHNLFSTNFLRWENEEKTRRKRSIKFYETINFISRYPCKEERSKKSTVNSNDFNAGKIWWQFHLTIITTTRPHMSRCIRVTRNTLLYSLQRFHVIYRVQKHAYIACWESLQPFRESSPVSLSVSALEPRPWIFSRDRERTSDPSVTFTRQASFLETIPVSS